MLKSCDIINPGEFAHSLAFQTATANQEVTYGSKSESWSTTATRRGSIEPLTGREFWQARQAQADVTHKIRVPYDSTIAALTPASRITYDSRTFNILSIVNVNERSRIIEIMAKEVTL